MAQIARSIAVRSVVNFDHSVPWLERHAREVSANGSAKILIVFHGTAKHNFRSIIDSNLKVPDGQEVKHATDEGYFGKGIYTSPSISYASAYGKGNPKVIAALVGRVLDGFCSLYVKN